MPTQRPVSGLDASIAATRAAVLEHGLPRPDVLFLLATGAGLIVDEMEDVREVELGDAAPAPSRWCDSTLFSGALGGLSAWAIDDVGAEPLGVEELADDAPWTSAFPVWLAASCGASVVVHASAGIRLPKDAGDDRAAGVEIGGFAVVRDHVNLSGTSPLVGLGESTLGPLFPDQSRVHHVGLRRAVLARADELALPAATAVVACTAGPSLETPAEMRMLARLGADVAVQGLAAPLIACSHAGLACLALVAVTGGDGAPDVAELVERAGGIAGELDRLILSLTPNLERAVEALRTDANA